MEFLILGILEWRMRSITPFSFFSYFITFFKHEEDPQFRQALKTRATEIIFKAQNGKMPRNRKININHTNNKFPIKHFLKVHQIANLFFLLRSDVKFMVFKPSIISAAALLSASHELFPMQYPCFQKALSNCSYVKKVIKYGFFNIVFF